MFKNFLKDLWKVEKISKAPYRPLLKTMAFFYPKPVYFGGGMFNFFSDHHQRFISDSLTVVNEGRQTILKITQEAESERQTVLKKLRENDVSLTELSLCKWYTPAEIQEFAEVLKVNQTLRSLSISFRRGSIGDAGTIALAEALKLNQALQSLDLRENEIGDAGAQALAEALKVNQTLQSLNLNENNIGDVGAQALAEALKVNQTLQSLKLWKNAIGTAGIQALAEAFSMNQALQLLDLSMNKFGTAGAQTLFEALKRNQTLQSLDLSANNIGNTGAQTLAEALGVNQTLQTLDLAHNCISDAGAMVLAKAFANNRSVIECNLTYNEITDIGAKEFATELLKNFSLISFNLRWYVSGDPYFPDLECRDEKISDEVENQIDALINRNLQLMYDMYKAVKTGDIATVNKLVEQGVSLLISLNTNYYMYNIHYNTVLHCAVSARQYQMTAHLLQLFQERKLPLDTRNRDKKTAADLAQGTELETLFPLPQNELSSPYFGYGY